MARSVGCFLVIIMCAIIPVAVGVAVFEAWKPTESQVAEAVRHQNVVNSLDEARRSARLGAEIARDRALNLLAVVAGAGAALFVIAVAKRRWVTAGDIRPDKATGLFPQRPYQLRDTQGRRVLVIFNPNQMPTDVTALAPGETGWERLPMLPDGVPVELLAEAGRQGRAVQAFRAMVSGGGVPDQVSALGRNLFERRGLPPVGPVRVVGGGPGVDAAVQARLGLPYRPGDPEGWRGDGRPAIDESELPVIVGSEDDGTDGMAE